MLCCTLAALARGEDRGMIICKAFRPPEHSWRQVNSTPQASSNVLRIYLKLSLIRLLVGTPATYLRLVCLQGLESKDVDLVLKLVEPFVIGGDIPDLSATSQSKSKRNVCT